MEMILFICLGAAAVLGLLIGFVKGFTRVNSWGMEFVMSFLVVVLVGRFVKTMEGGTTPGIIMFAAAIGSMLVFKLFSSLIRSGFRRHKRKHLEKLQAMSVGGDVYSVGEDDGMNDDTDEHFDDDDDGMNDSMDDDDDGMNDDMDEGEAEAIVSRVTPRKKALTHKQKRALKKGEKGACGVVDRIFGSVTLAVKGAVIVALIVSVLLVMVDLIQIKQVTQVFSELLDGKLWGFAKPYVMDMFVIAILFLCVKSGYSSGFSQTLWSLILIALVAGAGFASWNLAFNVEAFVKVGENLAGHLAKIDFLAKIAETVPVLSTLNIAKSIIMVGLFILLIVVIVLLKTFVPKMLFWARDSSVVYVIDGFFGALFASAVVFGVLMGIGHVLQPISDMDIMASFTAYFKSSNIANYIYTNNLLTAFGVPVPPIREWLS